MIRVLGDRGPDPQDQQVAGSKSRVFAHVPIAIILVCLSACVDRDPQAAYDRAKRSYRHGDMATAEAEAAEGYRNFHGVSSQWAWQFTILKAKILNWQGDNDRALELLTSEPGHLPSGDLAVQKHRLGTVAYAALNRFPEAERELAAAQQLCTDSPYPSCRDLASTQGVLEMRRGRYSDGQRFLESALTSSRAVGDDRFLEANILLNLSWSADMQTHFDEALDWADAARRIAVPQDFSDIAQTALGNMGWAYYKLGDPEKAEMMFIEARDQARKLDDLASQAGWLAALGYVYVDVGDFRLSEQSFLESRKLSEQINSREDIINSLIALAFVSEQTNKLDDAKRYADEALAKAREDNDAPDQVYLRLVQARIAARLHDAATAESAFRQVAQSPDCPVFLKWEAERSLARLYEDENQFDSADGEYRTALDTFETARSELQHEDSRLPFLSNASRIYDGYIHFLVARGKTAEALQVADFSRARTLSEGLGLLPKGTSFAPGALNARQVSRHAGGTILFYWLGEEQSYLWAITPQKVALFPLPPEAEIKTRVERYRKAIIDQRESTPSANDDGVALYRILVEPAKNLLPNNAGSKEPKSARVFIVPDGSLNSLNFETLLVSDTKPDTKPGTKADTKDAPKNDAKNAAKNIAEREPKPHYWIEDVTLSSASSLRVLQAFHSTNSKGAGNLLLFGDAISPNDDFPQLPKASVEMESIEKHFSRGQEQVFSREHASPSAYLASQPERFSYIHFVAHGTASRLSPLDSAIVLSKTNARVNAKADEEEDSFKLYARDIIRHPLHAELVTVSTCRSAGARAYSGEGLVGLSWAFVRAGAHNVIGALWDVSDASTPQLMDELYGQLKKGEAPDAALRKAKLNLLHSGASFGKPFYWAPFQLYTGS
jgi:CHAT domain-containing protein